MGAHHKPPGERPNMFDLCVAGRQPGGSINIEIVRGRCQKITHLRSSLGALSFSAVGSSGFELSSRVASQQRSRDFTRDTLTALCLERTMLELQVTQRVTREPCTG
jgi:hypothetical protein